MIVTLVVSSFSGITPRAKHSYGKLVCRPRNAVELTRPLTAEEARVLNVKDGWDGWQAGMDTKRFDTEAELHALAAKVWLEHFKDGGLLMVGDHTDPREVLAGPAEWVDKLNAIWREYAKLKGWEGDDEPRVEELCDEWDGYVEGFK